MYVCPVAHLNRRAVEHVYELYANTSTDSTDEFDYAGSYAIKGGALRYLEHVLVFPRNLPNAIFLAKT